jgi:UDP-N-acetylglucosamine transferase subunit ALG13
MILVSVGTNEARFDRLLRAVDELHCSEQVIVQHGPSAIRPANARCVDYLPFEELVEHVRAARVVITHAGVGSVMVSLANGKRPLVVPRLRCFGEAVDDHQVPLARRLSDAGLVTLAEDPGHLREALAAPEPTVSSLDGGRWLGDDLRTYLTAKVGTPVSRSGVR